MKRFIFFISIIITLTIHVSALDVTDFTIYYTSDELSSALYYPLSEQASHYIEYGEKYGIDPIFLAAKDALESGWGRSRVAAQYNNLSGWTGTGGYLYFYSEEECISKVTKFLKEHYIESTGQYYNGTTVAAINVYYNGRDSWEVEIKQIYNQIESRLNEEWAAVIKR